MRLLASGESKIEFAIRNGWDLTLCSKSAADDIAHRQWHEEHNVQVMIDTGMARAGITVSRAADLFAQVAQWPSLKLTGVCTHMAGADMPGDLIGDEQLAHFRQVTKEFEGKIPLHAANSAAIFFMKDSHFDMVRPGISLYGIDPMCRPSMKHTATGRKVDRPAGRRSRNSQRHGCSLRTYVDGAAIRE